MTIAANRYTAIAKPTIRWEGRRLALVVVAVFLLAFACTSVRFMMDVRVVDDGEGGYTMMNLNKAADLPGAVVSISASGITCFASFAFEMSTLRAYRRLSASNKRKLREDYRLLVYAILELIGQFMIAIFFIFQYVIGPMTSHEVHVVTLRSIQYIVDVLALGSPVCLFLTSGRLRTRYSDFYGMECLVRKPVVAMFSVQSASS
ncbi:hypothetical protein AAVH_27001 [Aphelenchoides avenae]|nr:hypothetical protein AAVH_27001 [Aphelenchus avenae]